jgi:hypothetical protein
LRVAAGPFAHLPPPVPKASATSVPSTATAIELRALLGAAKDSFAAWQCALDDFQRRLAALEAPTAIEPPAAPSVATNGADTELRPAAPVPRAPPQDAPTIASNASSPHDKQRKRQVVIALGVPTVLGLSVVLVALASSCH